MKRMATGNTGWTGASVVGMDELNREMMRLAKDASGPEVDAAIIGIANNIARDMQARAHPSLRYTIVAKPFKNNRPNVSNAFVTIDRNKKDSKGKMVGRLAHLFEFGTRQRFRNKVRTRGGGLKRLGDILMSKAGNTGVMPERPFFRPVVNEWRGGKFITELSRKVKSIIERREFNDTWGGM